MMEVREFWLVVVVMVSRVARRSGGKSVLLEEIARKREGRIEV
jgi:hypothetical protein